MTSLRAFRPGDLKGAVTALVGDAPKPTPAKDGKKFHEELKDFEATKWLLLGDGDGHRAYFRRDKAKKTATRWGQLKLLMSEVQFLTLYWQPEEIPKPFFVYAGSAPGHHVVILAKMFPDVDFHLYDPRDLFDPELRSLSNVHLYVQKFGDEEVERWQKEQERLFFISDIRGRDYNNRGYDEEANRQNEEIADRDMQLQMGWVQKLRPVKAMLKFRLPYSYDFIKAKGKTYSYLDGTIFRQQWAPPTSTEGRLVPHSDLSLRDWDYQAYEEAMFYFNTVVRERFHFKNIFTGTEELMAPEKGLTNDYDSVATAYLTREYLKKFGATGTLEEVKNLVGEMVKSCAGGRMTLMEKRDKSHLSGETDDEE
jgi:hypothetical protein